VAKAPNNKKLIAISIVAYVVFLIALMPVNVVYKALAPKNLPVDVVAVSGTLWDGNLVVNHPMTGQVSTDWQLSVLPLFWGQLALNIELSGNQLELDSHITAFPISQTVTLGKTTGLVGQSLINKAIRQTQRTMEGDVEINIQALEYNFANKQALKADGNLVWLGGEVSYPVGRKTKRTTMPMLVAKLSEQQGRLLVDLQTTDGNGVAQAHLNTDGWGGVSIYKRMLDLINEPWPGNVGPDDVIFEVSERVLK